MKRTKYYVLLIGMMMFWSCNDASKNNQPKEITMDPVVAEKSSLAQEKVAAPDQKETPITNIDIASIKNLATEGITSFNMDSLSDPKNYLDNSIINEVLGKMPVNGRSGWFLKANEWERFSCYQWEENEHFFLFNLLQQDESCCLTMYLCVTDQEGKLLAIRQLGLSGGDGGWFENDQGERMGFGKYKVTYDSYYDEDQFENETHIGYQREREYSELMIQLTKGEFKADTLQYIKTDTLVSY